MSNKHTFYRFGWDPDSLAIHGDWLIERGEPLRAAHCRYVSALLRIVWHMAEWHPTGSRYFGDWGDTSDWDYFAEDSPELRDNLRNFGIDVRESFVTPTNNAAYPAHAYINDTVTLILTDQPAAWEKATEIVNVANSTRAFPMMREERIQVFNSCRAAEKAVRAYENFAQQYENGFGAVPRHNIGIRFVPRHDVSPSNIRFPPTTGGA